MGRKIFIIKYLEAPSIHKIVILRTIVGTVWSSFPQLCKWNAFTIDTLDSG